MSLDLTAEGNLLSALLVTDWETGVDKAAVIVRPDDFIDREKARLYEAMLWLRDNGRKVDCLGCFEAMRELRVKDEDASRIVANCFDAFPLSGNIERYARAVKEQSRIYRMSKTIVLANSRLKDGENVGWVKNELLADIEEAERDLKNDEDCLVDQPTDSVLASIYDRMHGDDSKQGLKTGLRDLDETTSGINREELWILGGMPGRGKSALALQVALNVAESGKPVYFVSLEMSRFAIIRRLLKMRFGAAMVQNPGRDFQKLLEYREELKSLPLFINDSASLDAEDLASRIRSRIVKSKLSLAIVDYIQLVRCDAKDRRERVGEVTDRLRRLAKDTGTPILALSQLRRPANIDDRPSMIDLKESGDIEAHAHVVLLIYTPTEPEQRGMDEIIVGKQREGPVGKIDVSFIGEKGKFYERVK